MSSDCHLPSKIFVSHTSWTLFQILRTCFSAGATRSGFNVFVYLEPLTVGLTALYYTNLRFCRLKVGFVEEGGDGAVAFSDSTQALGIIRPGELRFCAIVCIQKPPRLARQALLDQNQSPASVRPI
jgi:hypothetical protein